MAEQNRYDKIKSLFLQACERTEEQRTSFLEEACESDKDLRKEVEALLAEHDTATAAGTAQSEAVTQAPTAAMSTGSGGPRAEEPVPERIGQYKILHRLGKGGMGIVYMAVKEEGRFTRRAAIKVVKRGLDTEDVLRRFELERQVLGALNHPGIARLFDAGATDDGRPYYAMEFVEGERIDDYCETKRLDVADRLELFVKVCQAVHYAHQNLVVHRDLKPDNIIVNERGEPKLLDFGIAKLLNPDLSTFADDYTAPDRRVMTPRYASPEQARGLPITTASDVYSLGVLLYELLTGHAPYRLKSFVRQEIERVICEVDPEKPSTAISRVETIQVSRASSVDKTPTAHTVTPETVSKTRATRPDRLRKKLVGDIDNIVLMALRKEPQRRYSSAEQFATDLQKHLQGQPVVAAPDTMWYRTSKFVHRNRATVAAAAMIALALVLGLAGTTWQASVAKAERNVAQEQRDLAERRFGYAWDLSQAFIYDFYDEIKMLEGSLGARELIVTEGTETLDKLAQEAADNQALMGDLADGYQRLGVVQNSFRRGNLGDSVGAAENFGKAKALLDALVAANPDDEDIAVQYFAVNHRLGDALRDAGESEACLAQYRVAVGICDDWSARDPEDDAWTRRKSISLISEGDARRRMGEYGAAAEIYRQAMVVRRELLEKYPDGDNTTRDYTVALGRLAGALEAEGEFEQALEHRLEALQIRKHTLTLDPTSERSIRDVLTANHLAGTTLQSLDRYADARPLLEEALIIAEQRVADSPRDMRARQDLARQHLAMGDVMLGLEDFASALESYRQAQLTAVELHEADVNNTAKARAVADALACLGGVREKMQDIPGAIEHFREGIELLDEIVDRDPDDHWSLAYLAKHRTALAALLIKERSLNEAGVLLDAASADYRKLESDIAESVQMREQFDEFERQQALYRDARGS
jgi:serine/threonine protein kinase